MRIERYPFCARRCLSKKRKRNWERIEWFTRSKLIVLVCHEPQWFYSLPIQWLFSCWYRISCPLRRLLRLTRSLRNQIQFKQAHEILMTVTIFFTTLTLNGLTLEFIPKNASSNKEGGRLRCLKCLTEFNWI